MISIQGRHKRRVYAVLSHFSAKRLTTVLSTPTEPFHENLPSFFEVCQRVDRFIDTLKGLANASPF